MENPESTFDIGFALTHNLTPYWNADLRYRIVFPKKNEKRPLRNILLELFSTAKSGTGKSTVAITIAYQICKLNNIPFSIKNNVFFSATEFLEAIKDPKRAVKGNCFVFDETRRGESGFGVGSTSISAKVSDVFQVARAKSINGIRIFGGEHRWQSINPHFRIDVNKINPYTNENLSLIMDGKDRYRGFIITKRPDNKELWREYEAKKMAFIEQTLQDEHQDRFKLYEKMANELLDDDDFSFCNNKKEMRWIFYKKFGGEHPKTVADEVVARAMFLKRKQDLTEEE